MASGKWHTVQDNFLSGELSPEFAAQVDADMTRSGLRKAKNALLLRAGGITTAPGSTFLSDIGAGAADKVRIWPFLAKSSNRTYLAVFRDDRVYVVTDLDAAQGPAQGFDWTATAEVFEPLILNNADFSRGFDGWDQVAKRVLYADPVHSDTLFTQWAAQNVGGEDLGAVFIHTDYNVSYGVLDIYKPRTDPADPYDYPATDGTNAAPKLSRSDLTAPFDCTKLSFSIDYSWYTFKGRLDGTYDIRVRIGTTAGGGELLNRVYTLNEDSDTENPQTLSDIVALSPGDLNNGDQVFFEVTMGWTYGGRDYDEDSAGIRYRNIQVFVSGDVQPVIADLATVYTNDDLDDLHFLQSPFDDKELLVFHPNFPTQALYLDTTGPPTWTFAPYGYTSPPSLWSGTTYPSVAAAFQGRLFISGVESEPETVWGSRVGDWRDFTVPGASPVADDEVEFTPTDRGFNTWLMGFKQLLFGNTVREYAVRAQSGIIQPGDVGVSQQTSYGSQRNPQKIVADTSIMVPTKGNTSLRMVDYTDATGGFTGREVGDHAKQLLNGGIRRMVYVRDPQESLWCVLATGKVAVMNMAPQLERPGWTELDFGGVVLDACAMQDINGRSVVLLMVERSVSGVRKVYLESVYNLADTTQWYYVHSFRRTFVDPTLTAVPGFDHLEGREVAVFADRQFIGMQTVLSGEVVVEEEATEIVAGEPYTYLLETFPERSLDPAFGLASKKRYVTAGVRTYRSHPPIINGSRPADRSTATSMGLSGGPLDVKDYEVPASGWDTINSITVEQDLPVRCTVMAIFAQLRSNEV